MKIHCDPLWSLIPRDSLTGFSVDPHTFRAYQSIFSHEQTLLLSLAFRILRMKTSVPCKGHSQDQLASISKYIDYACFKASAAGPCGSP